MAQPCCPFTSLTRTTHPPHPPSLSPGVNRGPCLQPKLIQALSAPSWTSPIFPPRNLELELRDLQVIENEDCRHSGKESTCQCRGSKRYTDSIPGSGRFLGEGNGTPLPGKSDGQRTPEGYHSLGLQRVGHDSACVHTNTMAAFAFAQHSGVEHFLCRPLPSMPQVSVLTLLLHHPACQLIKLLAPGI